MGPVKRLHSTRASIEVTRVRYKSIDILESRRIDAPMTVSFLGLDLAWRSGTNPTGGVALRGTISHVEVAEVSPALYGLEAVEDFIRRNLAANTVVAVDAPLIITNAAGQRRCELELSQRYGGQHASCHSSNLNLYPDASGVRLAAWLTSLGFVHAVDNQPRVMFEVYPHAAFVALFNLASIIRYKKGSIAQKCDGLRTVQETLGKLPIVSGPLLEGLLKRDPAGLRGQTRKSFEDSLDALFCAYLAYHYWRHGKQCWTLFGDRQDGYIANPSSALVNLHVAAA